MFSADSPQSFLEHESHEDQLHGSYWILWGLRFGALGGFWVESVGFQVPFESFQAPKHRKMPKHQGCLLRLWGADVDA